MDAGLVNEDNKAGIRCKTWWVITMILCFILLIGAVVTLTILLMVDTNSTDNGSSSTTKWKCNLFSSKSDCLSNINIQQTFEVDDSNACHLTNMKMGNVLMKSYYSWTFDEQRFIGYFNNSACLDPSQYTPPPYFVRLTMDCDCSCSGEHLDFSCQNLSVYSRISCTQ